MHEDGAPSSLRPTRPGSFSTGTRPSTTSATGLRGFTVIQAVVLERNGPVPPLRARPLHDNDPTRPNDVPSMSPYSRPIAALGLTIGMLRPGATNGTRRCRPRSSRWRMPTMVAGWASGTASPIIWILGGDRPVESATQREIIARWLGLKEGDGGTHLASFHPMGGRTSAEDWHAEGGSTSTSSVGPRATRQLSPDRGRPQAPRQAVYGRRAGLRGPPVLVRPQCYLDDYDVRKGLYWALFSAPSAYTYGCQYLANVAGGSRAGNIHRRLW